MAAYSQRKRDPLLDSNTQAAIEKRSRELLGIGLIVLGVLAAMMFFSYTNDDPSWISATDAPVQNWLGLYGATTAATLVMIVGKGVWVLPLTLIAWGARFAFHFGSERAVTRVIFAPIAVAVASLYAATLAPGADWPPNFGMGGLFGDTVLGVVLTVLPMGASFAVKLMSLMTFIPLLVLMFFVLGCVKSELRAAFRFMFVGIVITYAFILKLLGRGAAISARAAGNARETVQARVAHSRENRAILAQAAAEEEEALRLVPAPSPEHAHSLKARAAAVVRANPAMPVVPAVNVDGRKMPPMSRAIDDAAQETAPLAAPARTAPPQPTSFLSGLLKRSDPMPQPEMVTNPGVSDVPAGNPDRVSARIADAIRSRAAPTPAPEGLRIEPSLTEGRGPRPLLLDALGRAKAAQEAEMATDVVEPIAEPVLEEATLPPAPALNRGFSRQVAPTPEPIEEPVIERIEIPVPEAKKVVQHPLKRATMPSKQALAEAQPALSFEEKYADY